jgi:hypothetical protein
MRKKKGRDREDSANDKIQKKPNKQAIQIQKTVLKRKDEKKEEMRKKEN